MSASDIPCDTNEFTSKRILVTGGTRGIGEAIVNRLRRGGGTVLATARTVPASGSPEQFIQADVSTRAGADHVIKTTFDRLGGLDILINSVGGSSAPAGGVLALTDAIWQQEFELNLFSAVRLDRGFLPAMLEQRSGVIIHISSIQRTLPLFEATRDMPPRKPLSRITARDFLKKSPHAASASIVLRPDSPKPRPPRH
jgi:NAD(P)-dependent dehydrogenase (short-subunit alcohol dehydrogenase family)